VRIEPGEGIQGIRCSVIHTTLNQAASSYEALSYTWGDPGEREDIIVVCMEGNWLLLAIAWPLFDYCDTLTDQYWHG
jgi:hypothetical protein